MIYCLQKKCTYRQCKFHWIHARLLKEKKVINNIYFEDFDGQLGCKNKKTFELIKKANKDKNKLSLSKKE